MICSLKVYFILRERRKITNRVMTNFGVTRIVFLFLILFNHCCKSSRAASKTHLSSYQYFIIHYFAVKVPNIEKT